MRTRFLIPLFFAVCLHAIHVPTARPKTPHPEVKAPWFTGPLLAPSALTVPPGHCNIEPYLYSIANVGVYGPNWKASSMPTFWTNYFQPSIQVGILSWLDFQFNPTLFYNYHNGAANWNWGDMPIGFDIQLYKHIGKYTTDWTWALRLTLKEIVPMGRYQKLRIAKQGTDVGGGGSWQTGFALVWGSVSYLDFGKGHFFAWRTALQYTLPAPTHVKGLNAYGGGPGTNGTVYPSQDFVIDNAFEFTLTQNWVFAMDMVGAWSGKNRFKGKTAFSNTTPPSTQFSLAPAIEYNWSSDIGIIFGPWFTIAGRNAPQFASAIFAFNYYH